MSELESNDAVLARTIAPLAVVLARAGVNDAGASRVALARTPVMLEGEGDLFGLLRFGTVTPNVSVLEAAARGFGLVNATRDADGVVRRVPLIMSYDGEAMPSLAVELLRLGVGANWLTVKTDAKGVTAIGLADSELAADADGQLTVYFSAADLRPLHRV